MDEQEKKKRKEKAYQDYVKTKTPVHNVYLNMAKAFVTGGTICVVGQFFMNFCKNAGCTEEISGTWTSLILVLLSVLLTGWNLYPGIAKWGGAGALVPITGFANSVVAPAIEFHAEGEVFGVGCKIFTIAGPVILYGVLTSWVLGLIYWVGTMMGIF
jgi:stage V sporulation protein AC